MGEKLLSNPYTIRGRGRLKIKFFACFNTKYFSLLYMVLLVCFNHIIFPRDDNLIMLLFEAAIMNNYHEASVLASFKHVTN